MAHLDNDKHFDIVVGMFRAPQEVVASYVGQKWVRGLGKRKIALGYWRRFNQSLLVVHDLCKDKKPFHLLDYDDEQIPQVELLCDRLGLAFTPEARALYKPSLKHYDSARLPVDRDIRVMYQELLTRRILKP